MTMDFFKKNKVKLGIGLVFLIIFSVIIGTASGREKMTGAENLSGGALNPIQGFFFNLKEKASVGLESVGDIFTLKAENKKLTTENAKLKEEILKYEETIGKTDFLKSEFELRKSSKYEFAAANVTAKEPGNWFEKFTINKGSNDGIKAGAPVILGIEADQGVIVEGLVGKITEVGDNWAKVNSIVDVGNNVSFRVVRNGDGGVVRGNLDGGLDGYMFDTKTTITKGDKIVTSGIGGVYQEGVYIGEVSEVKKKTNDLLVHIKVDTGINFSKVHEVFVITGIKE